MKRGGDKVKETKNKERNFSIYGGECEDYSPLRYRAV